jgi:hypothetical protein
LINQRIAVGRTMNMSVGKKMTVVLEKYMHVYDSDIQADMLWVSFLLTKPAAGDL